MGNERLGANGCAEVKDHPFFAEIVWKNLAAQTEVSPLLINQSKPYYNKNKLTRPYHPEERFHRGMQVRLLEDKRKTGTIMRQVNLHSPYTKFMVRFTDGIEKKKSATQITALDDDSNKFVVPRVDKDPFEGFEIWETEA